MSSGRTIAIGDIHGCDVALETLLEMIEPQPDDLIVVLGDVIDRGPDSRRCIEQILELRQRVRLVHLMGNHEEMMLDAMYGGEWKTHWPSYGGHEMLASYGGSFDEIPEEHLAFIKNSKDFFEIESHIFVHGYLRPQVMPEQEEAMWLRWARFQPTDAAHLSGKRVICGHTAQSKGRPVVCPHYVCIDTCAYCPEGFLSALDVESDVLWQASQSGSVRGPMPLAAAGDSH
jgi:serine/threonine protein phosphatase 1